MSTGAPLSITLNTQDAKTVIPKIADGTWVKLRFVGATQSHVENKGDVITFESDLIDPAPSHTGDIILPGALGSKIFEQIQCYAKEGAKNPNWFVEKISKRIDAMLGTGDADNKKGRPQRPQFDAACVAQLVGKTYFAQMGVRVDDNKVERQDINAVAFEEDMKLG